MRSITLFSLLFVGAFANSHLAEKRGDAACNTKVSKAYDAIKRCSTSNRFCTSYLGRGPKTYTRIGTTETITVTDFKTTTITKPKLVTATITQTETAVAATETVHRTSKGVGSVTRSDKATTSVTTTVTKTISAVQTIDETVSTTITQTTVKCSNPPQKRSAFPAAEASCRIASNIRPAQVSGACGCLIDRTITRTATVTRTKNGPRLTRTQTLTTTSTSTISKTLTTTPTTTVVAIATTGFTTVTTVIVTTITSSFTLTGATVRTTVSSVTFTHTATSTVKNISPTCTPGRVDNDNEGKPRWEYFCNTNFAGYTVEVTDADDIYECIYSCEILNGYAGAEMCVAVSFYQNLCSKNCHLKQGVLATNTASDPDWQSARMFSPAVSVWGNYCKNPKYRFGDIYLTGGKSYQLLCGMNIQNTGPGATEPATEEDCWNECAETDGCVAATSYGQGSCGFHSTNNPTQHYWDRNEHFDVAVEVSDGF